MPLKRLKDYKIRHLLVSARHPDEVFSIIWHCIYFNRQISKWYSVFRPQVSHYPLPQIVRTYLRTLTHTHTYIYIYTSSKALTTLPSAFSDSVYHIYHSFLKIIANSCTSLLAKGFIFISDLKLQKAHAVAVRPLRTRTSDSK